MPSNELSKSLVAPVAYPIKICLKAPSALLKFNQIRCFSISFDFNILSELDLKKLLFCPITRMLLSKMAGPPPLILVTKNDCPEAILPSGIVLLTPELAAALVPMPPNKL